jgi:hypothetical protein
MQWQNTAWAMLEVGVEEKLNNIIEQELENLL